MKKALNRTVICLRRHNLRNVYQTWLHSLNSCFVLNVCKMLNIGYFRRLICFCFRQKINTVKKTVEECLCFQCPVPIALFFINNKMDFLPIAIQLQQEKSNKNPASIPKCCPCKKLIFNLAMNISKPFRNIHIYEIRCLFHDYSIFVTLSLCFGSCPKYAANKTLNQSILIEKHKYVII